MALSKRLKKATAALEAKTYTVAEAIKFLRLNPAKFNETIEVHVKLGIDPKKSDQIVRASVALPHGTGKTIRVAAFVTADKEAEAKSAGADLIGGEDLVEDIKKTGKTDFDIAIATPEIMKLLAPIAKTLGQKGLMPNPKTGTVGTDVSRMVSELKKGKVNFKNDDGANVHIGVGKLSFTDEQLEENIVNFVDALKKAKPEGSKGTFVKSVYVTSTMGPSLKVQI